MNKIVNSYIIRIVVRCRQIQSKMKTAEVSIYQTFPLYLGQHDTGIEPASQAWEARILPMY